MYQRRMHRNIGPPKTRIFLRLSGPRGFPLYYVDRSRCHGRCLTLGCLKHRLPTTSNSRTFGCFINHETRSYHHFAKQDWYHFQGRIKNKRKLQANQGIHQRYKVEKFTHYSNLSRTRIQHRRRLWVHLQDPNSKEKFDTSSKDDHHQKFRRQQARNFNRVIARRCRRWFNHWRCSPNWNECRNQTRTSLQRYWRTNQMQTNQE